MPETDLDAGEYSRNKTESILDLMEFTSNEHKQTSDRYEEETKTGTWDRRWLEWRLPWLGVGRQVKPPQSDIFTDT